jgi:hypothetical protein
MRAWRVSRIKAGWRDDLHLNNVVTPTAKKNAAGLPRRSKLLNPIPITWRRTS